MLLRENFTEEHISKLRTVTGADPAILERTVFAFGLLEAICSVGLPFIFKGGTSLLVMLKNPKRLSTDIDIIVNRGTDIDAFIDKAGKIFPFDRAEEQKRKVVSGLEKRHFKFFFQSLITRKNTTICLQELMQLKGIFLTEGLVEKLLVFMQVRLCILLPVFLPVKLSIALSPIRMNTEI